MEMWLLPSAPMMRPSSQCPGIAPLGGPLAAVDHPGDPGCLGLVRPRLWSLASRAHGAGVDEVGDTGLVLGRRADGLGDQLRRAEGTSGTFWSTFGADGAGEHGHTRRRRPRAAAVVALLVLAAVVGTGYGVLTAHHSGPLTPGTATAVLPSEPAVASPTTPARTADAAPTGSPVPVLSTTSYDPSGGSGFVRVGPGSYETQHYASAAFGGLKPGVGLLLDLGQARTISAVEVTSAAAGTRGGLVGLDSTPPADSAAAIAAPVDLSDTTHLTPASHGPHRYWLLFITRLGDDSQGRYDARLSDVQVLS